MIEKQKLNGDLQKTINKSIRLSILVWMFLKDRFVLLQMKLTMNVQDIVRVRSELEIYHVQAGFQPVPRLT